MKHHQDKGPKYDLVRSQNKLWTSSQLAMNLNKNDMKLYLIPEQVEYIGIEDNAIRTIATDPVRL